MALAQVKEDREELRQERDDGAGRPQKLNAEKLIAEKLREADERLSLPRSAARVATPRGRPAFLTRRRRPRR